MKSLILAAGLGTRLRPYTQHTPKPLFSLNGQPVLDRIIDQLIRAGCREVMINTHHLHERIERWLACRSYPIPVRTTFEPLILGTGGAVRNVSEFWAGGPLLIVNADIVTDIDPAHVFRFHTRHPHAVTMVMHDCPRFNSVLVDPDAHVAGFSAEGQPPARHRVLAFTGIHVLEPRVLDFLPPDGPAHIIDAYARMLQAGEKIKALVVDGSYWQDIGTPESYRAAALDHMVPAAFVAAFGTPPAGPIEARPLQGDGSDRRWCRFRADGESLVMVDHGIRTVPDGQLEVDAFVDIGRHLKACGASVPQIYLHDAFSGIVFVEDWGDRHLQAVARDADPLRREAIYRKVIDRWLVMAVEGGRGFDPTWTWQTPRYDKDLILERECRYFVESFLNGFLGEPIRFEDLSEEFAPLADSALQYGFFGFMHRDLQSRNIMVRDDRIGFIDFQGGRRGPLQYDLASLLIDPYVSLSPDLQNRLKAYAARELERLTGLKAPDFLAGYDYCALTRNLQMLGAFGFLSRVKGKQYFEAFIPAALAQLDRTLSGLKGLRLPRLASLAARLADNRPKEDK
jgi:aminoglycoside/choline kinase family phosphotransferase/dTDP-glucose pyrophosphorylase